MKVPSIKIASASDIHLGHPRVPTYHIIKNLRAAFPNNEITGALDLIVLPGDVFDRILELPQNEVYAIRAWILYMFKLCEKWDITLVVLEGTPSHDNKQSRMFQEILDMSGLKVDFHYVETLCVLHLERFGINALCVPDEWSRDPMVTYRDAVTALKDANLEKADIGLMHGAMEYQLPPAVREKHPPHETSLWRPLVKYVIFIGHVHTYSEFGTAEELDDIGAIVVAQGSFDRLAHREERPKGHVRATIENGTVSTQFIENKGATIFKTFDIEGLDMDQVLRIVAEACKTHPKGSFFRLSGKAGDIGLSSVREIQGLYQDFFIDPHTKKVEEIKAEEVDLVTNVVGYTPVNITEDNIWQLTADFLKRKGVDPWQIADCEVHFHERLA